MSITLRTRKDGSKVYEIRVSRGRDPETGKQLTPYTQRFEPPANCPPAKAEKLAKRAEERFVQEILAGKVKAGIYKKGKMAISETDNIMLSQYIKMYLENKAIYCRPVTIHTCAYAIRMFTKYLGGDIALKAVTKNHAKGFLASLVNEKHLSYATIKENTKKIKALFEEAKNDEIIDRNPFDNILKPLHNFECNNDKEDKMFTDEELAIIMEHVENLPFENRGIFYFLIETGCRASEVSALQWGDVDIPNGAIKISATIECVDGERIRVLPKNGNTRMVYMSDEGKLKGWLKERQAQIEREARGDEAFVFTNTKGDRIDRRYCGYLCEKLQQKCVGIHIYPHKFRHTMVSKALQAGVDIATVSKMAGHSNVAITAEVYAHSDESSKKRGTDTFVKYLNGLK